ncbi:MAG: nitroreductase [Cryomorphaceae bacterium]
MKLSPQESLAWIAQRRSVFPKEFDDDIVSRTEIESLLEAARWAPTHKLTEPWHFQVFMGASKKQLTAVQVEAIVQGEASHEVIDLKSKKFEAIASRSSAVIAVILKRDPTRRIPRYEEEWAIATAVQNIQLHATSFDIGMYWSTGAATNSAEINAFLGLSQEDLHMGWLYLGRFKERKELVKERKEVSEFVAWR